MNHSRRMVLWNPHAGSAGSSLAARDILADQPGTQIIETRSVDHARNSTRQALEEGCREIIVAGGDGSINTVGEQIIRGSRSEVVLGIIPTGTGNDLARELAIPLDPLEAARFLPRASVRTIDAIDVRYDAEQRVALNTFGGGNTGKYTQTLTSEQKELWGAWCFVRGAIDVLRDLEHFGLTLQIDDSPSRSLDVLNLFCANGPVSGGGLTVAPPARLDDGHLDLVVIRDGPAIDLANLAATYLAGSFLDHELVEHCRVKSLKLTAAEPLPVAVDGLEFAGREFQLRVLPRAIRVRTGPEAPGLSVQLPAGEPEG